MYTSKTAIQNYLLTNIADSFDTQIDEWIEAVDNFIDNYCNTSFEPTTAIKYYNGRGNKELVIDDLISLTTLNFLKGDGTTVDDTLTENDDFFLYPLNKTPKHKVVLAPEGDYVVFPFGPRRVKITGSWGVSSEVPKDIKYIATKLVVSIIEVGKAGEVKLKSEKIGDYAVTYDRIANSDTKISDILNKYRLYNLGR